MHAFYDTVRFEHEMFIGGRNLHDRAIVGRVREDPPAFSTRKMKQNFVEEPVFAQSTDIH